MKRFKNILVVFDRQTDNGALFDQAVGLAQRNQATVMVVDVIEEAPHGLAMPVRAKPASEAQGTAFHIIESFPLDPTVQPAQKLTLDGWKCVDSTTEEPKLDIKEYILQEEQRSLEQFVTAIRQAGIQVSGKTFYGKPFLEIIREVLRGQYDLVMLTAEGRGGLQEMLFGSTTMHLMRKCPCPVWVIKPGQSKQFTRVLAAVDLVPNDNERMALNTKIMELSTSLARSGQSELVILHTWTLFGESTLRSGRAGISNEAVERLLREAQDAHREWLIELLQRHPLDDLKYEVYLLKGDAGVLIPELAQAKEIDLIIMGTVSRAGIAGLLIGNTAEQVLRRVHCSMLTIKPEGFITPVKLEPA
jgi:nucleotide-binding universal stress UspA family protein